MIFTRTREIVVNLGNSTYESARLGATVSVDTSELDSGVDAWGWLDDQLSLGLASEVKYWHEITQKRDSAIHLVHQDNVAAERTEE